MRLWLSLAGVNEADADAQALLAEWSAAEARWRRPAQTAPARGCLCVAAADCQLCVQLRAQWTDAERKCCI